jgi:hypothetical protein
MNRICDEIREYFYVPICTVNLIGRLKQLLKAARRLETGLSLRDVAFYNYSILSDEVFVVEDARADERFRTNPFVTGAPQIRSYARAPDLAKNVQLGARCLVGTKPRTLSRGTRPSSGCSPTGSCRKLPDRGARVG